MQPSSAFFDQLLACATQAQAQAYAPYSQFPVGACLRGANGRFYAGCNVENSAYPNGSCAEAGAVSAMILDGETRITEVLVLGPDSTLCTPCGSCRQRLAEFADAQTPVHVCDRQGWRMSTTLGSLLPHAFDKPASDAPAALAPNGHPSP